MILDGLLDRLMAGRTTFLIAHRLSTIRDVDGVLATNAGRLGGRRTDDELFRVPVYLGLGGRSNRYCRATPTAFGGQRGTASRHRHCSGSEERCCCYAKGGLYIGRER